MGPDDMDSGLVIEGHFAPIPVLKLRLCYSLHYL